ncbi:hypothetical protein MMC07_007259 [Pseudocyphellaria aurata]|nr:hypothetical protein [Pseudocyphellaria aurata]
MPDIRTLIAAAKHAEKPYTLCTNDHCPAHRAAKENSGFFPQKPAKKPKPKKKPVDPFDDRSLTVAEAIQRAREKDEKEEEASWAGEVAATEKYDGEDDPNVNNTKSAPVFW